MEKPTYILSQEHKSILKIADALIKECKLLESGKKLDKDFFVKAIDFIKNYADKFHHAKEEEILFAELNKNSESLHCNPVQQMIYEHDLGRKFVKALEKGLNKNNKLEIIKNANAYAQLIQEHIFKEDNILFNLADNSLSPQIQESILKKFKQAEIKNFKKGTKEKYLSLAKEFENRQNE